MIDPKNVPQAEDLQKFNPLSTAKDSPWQQYFKNKELEKSIMQDIHRTHPDSEFFQQGKERKYLFLIQLIFFFLKNGSQNQC